MPTTRQLPSDLLAAFPSLERRTTVRLHPRRAGSPTPPAASNFGGAALWPDDEDWPRCPEDDDPLIPVLQLRADEVPEINHPFPQGLFQLLWCPKNHDRSGSGPLVKGYWRGQGRGRPRSPAPAPDAEEDLVPQRICSLSPERVVELPDAYELEIETVAELDEWVSQHFSRLLDAGQVWPLPAGTDPSELAEYQYSFSTAPGTKVGGHPQWIQDPEQPICEQCGAVGVYLLTVASAEFDGGSWWAWLPVEERGAYSQTATRRDVQDGAGLGLGDMGSVYVFVCRRCPDLPLEARFQCS